jgi:hypothetical protein
MLDEEFNLLKIEASVCPSAKTWPSGEINPSIKGDKPTWGGSPLWNALQVAVGDARSRLTYALAKLSAADEDKKLSTEGKISAKKEIAEEALAGLRKSPTLAKAREVVDKVTQQCASKVTDVVKPAWDVHDAAVHSQIRDRLVAMTEGRMAFLEKNAADPVISSAILTAPAFLSGLSDAEIALVRRKVELLAVGSEALAARDAAVRALSECEQGWRHAIAQVAQRGGVPLTGNGVPAE